MLLIYLFCLDVSFVMFLYFPFAKVFFNFLIFFFLWFSEFFGLCLEQLIVFVFLYHIISITSPFFFFHFCPEILIKFSFLSKKKRKNHWFKLKFRIVFFFWVLNFLTFDFEFLILLFDFEFLFFEFKNFLKEEVLNEISLKYQ